MVKTEGIKLSYVNNITNLDEEDQYKYIGILQADIINCTEVKLKVRSEYNKKVKKILNPNSVEEILSSQWIIYQLWGIELEFWTVLKLK